MTLFSTLVLHVHVPHPFRKKQKCSRGLRRVHDSSEASQRPKEASTTRYWKQSELTTGEKLGEGGFAVVYSVTAVAHPQTPPSVGHHRRSLSADDSPLPSTFLEAPQKYALKQLRPELLRDKKMFKQASKSLVAEAAFLGKLEHPNILKLRGLSMEYAKPVFHKSLDGYFIVTDRLEEILADRIARWQVESANGSSSAMITRKLDYASQIGSAIKYLHDQKIIFRDLKPDNIGFLDKHTVQLFDFGLAKDISPLVTTPPVGHESSNMLFQLTMCGTWRYAAPETMTTGRYNEKVDVYSWALVTHEMLLEQKPYHYMTPSVHQILVAHNGDRPPTKGFPFGLETLLESAWDHDILRRLTMTQALAKLEECQIALEAAVAACKALQEQKYNTHQPTKSEGDATEEVTDLWLELKKMMDAISLENDFGISKQLCIPNSRLEMTASAA